MHYGFSRRATEKDRTAKTTMEDSAAVQHSTFNVQCLPVHHLGTDLGCKMKQITEASTLGILSMPLMEANN